MVRLYLSICALVALSTGLVAQPVVKAKDRPIDFERNDTVWVTGTILAIGQNSILMTQEKKAPVTIPMHDCLANGKVHKLVHDANAYLLGDVKVGDLVTLDTIMENKQTYCVAIQIDERPGGLVPPSQNVSKTMPYHEIKNASIALRDKGTPIPEHLKPKMPIVPKK